MKDQRFDLIDTSNLADHLGPSNLMIVTAPLLKPDGLLRMELLVGRNQPAKVLDDLLFGDMVTISFILGLALDLKQGNAGSEAVDFVFVCSMVAFVALTATADQQQQNYYNAGDKYHANKKVTSSHKAEDLERGFNTTRFFAYSRQPNFAFEQSVWLTLFFWAATFAEAQKTCIVVSPVSYLLLFQASAAFSENVTRSKYSDYQIYQKKIRHMAPTPASSID